MNSPPFNASQRVRRLGVPGVLAAVLIVGAAVMLLVSASGLFAAVITPGANAAGGVDSRERDVENYSKALDGHRAQFDGRSILFVPGPPPTPPPPAPAVIENDEPPPPPPPPSEYKGPKLIGMVNGVAWFEDGTRLAPGERKGDVRLVKLDPPWDAQVEWKDVHFTVSLFARDSLINKREGVAPSSEPEPPEQPEPDAPPPPPPPAVPRPEGPPVDPPEPEAKP